MANNLTLVRSPNNRCNGKATMRSIYIVVELHVPVNNIKPLGVATETQLLLSYRIFRTVVNNMKVLMSSCKVPNIFFPISTKLGVSRLIFSQKSPLSNFTKIRPVGNALIYTTHNTHNKSNRHFSLFTRTRLKYQLQKKNNIHRTE
jgi:hypothetical protein